MSEVRVRFAPSPTGPLHLGGVRTALYNYLFAKKQGGKFILRIEDTDQGRFVPGAEEYILEALDWAGLARDEDPVKGGPFGPYRQSERKDLYRQYAEALLASGNAYYAFDTPEELDEMRENLKKQGVPSPQYNSVTRQYMKNSLTLPADEVRERLDSGSPYVIRIKMPRNEEVKLEDAIRGWVVFHSNQLDDKVLFKSDGMPTYHLANVVDDHLMKITHVIRGEEWLPSAPLHVLLYRYLGWEATMPQFAHLPLILKPDGNGKLSKRDGDRLGFPVFPLNWQDPFSGELSSGFRERGFLKDAFVNMLAFLGWNPGTSQEIFSMDELINAFDLSRVGKAGARFDFEKAKWFNQQYFRAKPDEELLESVRPIMKEKGLEQSDSFLLSFCRLLKDRVTYLKDFPEMGDYFFHPPTKYDEQVIQKKWSQERSEQFKTLFSALENLNPFTASGIEKTVQDFMAKENLKPGEVLPLIRVMTTGTVQGPPVFEMAELLGKETILERIKIASTKFDSLIVTS